MARQLPQPQWPHRPVPVVDGAVHYRIPLALARQFQQICVTAQAEALAGEVITAPMRYAALACIDDFPAIEQRRLATMIGADRTNVVQIVDELEAVGLIERRVSEADRRSRELTVTNKGRTLRRRLRPKVLASQALIMASLPPAEQDFLIDLLARVIGANQAYLRPGAGRRRPRSSTIRQEGGAAHVQKDTIGARDRSSSSRRSGAVRTA
jgi:DNA-binding MarR family transcriptional regulator